MGCLVGKSTAEVVLAQINEQNKRIEDYEKKLMKSETHEGAEIDIENFSSEFRKSIQNLNTLSKYFPLDSASEFNKKVENVLRDSCSNRIYVSLRLETSDKHYRISENFLDLMDKLKELDGRMCQKINSKAQSLDKILDQKVYSVLLPDFHKIKNEQIALSSFRGGNFDEIVMRLHLRFNLDKELEIIQSKIELKQHMDFINSEDSESNTLKAQITELRNNRSDLERAWDMVRLNTKNNDEEINQLKESHEDLEAKADSIEEKVSLLTRAKEDYETKLQVIVETQKNIEEVISLISQKEKEKKDLEVLYEDINDFQEKKHRIRTEIAKLAEDKEKLAEVIKNNQTDGTSNKEEINQETFENMKNLEEQLFKLRQESVELSDQIKFKEDENETHIKKLIAMRLKTALFIYIKSYFDSWKIINIIKKPEETKVEENFKVADLVGDDMIDSIDSDLKESNKLILSIKKENERPMSTVNLFKLFEDVMDRKYETDEKDIKDKRRPRSMIDFLQEHLSRVFGIAKIANKQLAQAIPALQELYEAQDVYGSIFCRLLGIFDPNPLPLPFAVYLVSARAKFSVLIEKYEKNAVLNSFRRSSRSKKEMVEEVKSGGCALANDVIDLTLSIFENYKNYGKLALKIIKPNEVSTEDYVVFQICQKIMRLGKNIESVFNLVDKDGSGSLDIKELSLFAKNNIDLLVDDNDLELCFSKLATIGTEEIKKEAFINRFSSKNYQELIRSKNYTISKAKFLNMLVEVFNEIQLKQNENLDIILYTYPNPLSKSEFNEIFRTIEPDFTQHIEKYFLEISEGGETASHQNVKKLFLKYCLGEHKRGPFAIKTLYDLKEERRVKTSVSLDESISITRDRSRTAYK